VVCGLTKPKEWAQYGPRAWVMEMPPASQPEAVHMRCACVSERSHNKDFWTLPQG